MGQRPFHRYDKKKTQGFEWYVMFALFGMISFYGIAQGVEAGTVEGYVLDPVGKPIKGVTVHLSIDCGSSTTPCHFKTNKKTSAVGYFSFEVSCILNPRPFTVSLSKPEYKFFPPQKNGTLDGSGISTRLDFEGVNLNDYSQITRLLKVSQICNDSPAKNVFPLILIHGIHGISRDHNLKDDSGYWSDFLDFFFSSPLCSHFELYIFQYYTDLSKGKVQNIARGLQFWLANQEIEGKQKIILAHSMGGLVGWSYINDWHGDSSILGMVTLATPFHGTPAANQEARTARVEELHGSRSISFETQKILIIFELADKIYWGSSLQFSDAITPSDPNRSDLRYDNYDCLLPLLGVPPQGGPSPIWELRTSAGMGRGDPDPFIAGQGGAGAWGPAADAAHVGRGAEGD